MAKIAFELIPENPKSVKDIVMAFASNGIFIHCEIHFADKSVGFSNSKSGVVLKSVNDRDYSKDFIFYEIPCTQDQERIIKDYFIQNSNLKYNWTGIVGNMITGLNMSFKGGQFCSQICFNSMVTAKVMKPYTFEPSELSPSDLQAIIHKLNWKLCNE